MRGYAAVQQWYNMSLWARHRVCVHVNMGGGGGAGVGGMLPCSSGAT